VLEHGADFGIAFDGDGDRVMFVDSSGKVLDGDAILYILATQSGVEVSAVVGTVMSNLGFENALKDKGITLHRTAVGDRYVMACMKSESLNYGAEPSGHVLCLDKTTTGDGIVAALQVLSAVINSGKSLEALMSDIELYPQLLKNIRVECASGLSTHEGLQKKVAECEALMGSEGRILIRASGTEPLIRVMVEGKNALQVENIAEELANLVKSEFS